MPVRYSLAFNRVLDRKVGGGSSANRDGDRGVSPAIGKQTLVEAELSGLAAEGDVEDAADPHGPPNSQSAPNLQGPPNLQNPQSRRPTSNRPLPRLDLREVPAATATGTGPLPVDRSASPGAGPRGMALTPN